MEDILGEVEQKLADGPVPDYVTLAGSGKPTLNSRLGQLIREIKKLTYIPIAVLTNGSLLWQREVQDALMEEGSVTTVRNNKTLFYETVRAAGKGIPARLKGTI
jgi:wyosine [tRNA(Phe)-imidazoG37] synthetase (radical SAM superfamily)